MSVRFKWVVMKTKDKIILASLDLFNEKGERNVTTNHIAAHLNMSPGNLYYHFRNKTDIIYEIFLQYEMLVDHYLRLPSNSDLTIEHMVFYLESVFDGLWSYRFFHRDLEYLLDCDQRLRRDYREFTMRCMQSIVTILKRLQKSGVIVPMEDDFVSAMALNVWLAITNWMAFLKTAHAGEENNVITKDMLKSGIYQVIILELPYIAEGHKDKVLTLKEKYRPQPFV